MSNCVTPSFTSTTSITTSASRIARSTCRLISLSKVSSLLTTHPPVSITENSLPHHSALPYWRSRVVPAVFITIALRVPVRRLNRVDFPTLGRPTIATIFAIVYVCCFTLFMYVTCPRMTGVSWGYSHPPQPPSPQSPHPSQPSPFFWLHPPPQPPHPCRGLRMAFSSPSVTSRTAMIFPWKCRSSPA